MTLGEPDASGRPQPRPAGRDEVLLDVDMVVSAIGQTKPLGAPVEGMNLDRGFLAVDGEFRTNRPKVFAGGDGIRSTGAASTVMAVQDGKLAARSIHAFLAKEAHRG